MGEGVEVELSKTFSFGKRGANISLARSESELTEALLADYFRNLHPSDPLEPVCQHTGNGCDRRDRNLCTLVSVLSEYTAFCTE